MIAWVESLRELAIMQPGVPVLSVHVGTDPRDPANTAVTPKWLVELRNGLCEVAGAANALSITVTSSDVRAEGEPQQIGGRRGAVPDAELTHSPIEW
jgi:hypothetical protein